MQANTIFGGPRLLRRLSVVLALYAVLGGAVSFAGWPLDMPPLTDWLDTKISIQPNTAALIALAGAALLAAQHGRARLAMTLGGLVAFLGGLNLLQHVLGADFGINHQLLFGRTWGQASTLSPGRVGPPASISLMFIGVALVMLGLQGAAAVRARRLVPRIGLVVVLLMTFSLLGYWFEARNFYSIPWLSAIALPTATMLLALAIGVILCVPEHQPMLLLCERSSAGSMARTVLPALALMIPSVTWIRTRGYELNLYDEGTGRALLVSALLVGTMALMWTALTALRRREQRERDADRRKDEFLATLAHELRNPLAPISNGISLLKVAAGNREVVERTSDMMARQLAQMVRLIDDLLDVSRISRGKLELRKECIELAPLIQEAVEICRPMVDRAKHQLTITLPPLPVYLNADPVRLCQVVSNVLHNACKFTEPGGRISLCAEPQGADLVIAVRDNGIGLPPDKCESIFQMFSQIDQSLERSRNGLGIGLALTKRLVELHGGHIEARSDGLGEGSEFVLRLTAAIDPRPPQPKVRDDRFKPIEQRCVLVVEDNRDSAESLAKLLRLTGTEAFIAYNGEDAVTAAETLRPDVILMDIGLPKLNGYEACRRIREQAWGKKILIIALTGWGQAEDRRKSLEAGFNGHMVKPVDPSELMRVLAGKPSAELCPVE